MNSSTYPNGRPARAFFMKFCSCVDAAVDFEGSVGEISRIDAESGSSHCRWPPGSFAKMNQLVKKHQREAVQQRSENRRNGETILDP